MPRLRPRRPAAPVLAAVALASLLLSAIAGAASAKEGLMVAFDAPIAFDTPPGTELLVGLTVTALTEDGEVPVQGSPIVLILIGRDGSQTEAHGVEDVPGSGHYLARISVPPGGARQARVVMRGSGGDGPADIDLWIITDPFTFGGITARTAQVAPAPTPGLTPFPRVTAAPQVPAATPAGAASGPASLTAQARPGAEGPAWWPPALGLLVLGIAVVVVTRLSFRRRPPQGT